MPWLSCARQAADGDLALDAPGPREPVPYSMVTGARHLIDSLDAISVFEVAALHGRACVRTERRIEALVLRTDGFVIRVGEGTPC